MPDAFTYELSVDPSAIDENGHVNNIEFVRWMQDAAMRHSDAAGCTAATRQAGCTWVVRSHQVEYLRPALAGDRIRVITWVADFRRVASMRKYRFERMSGDGAGDDSSTGQVAGEVLARGQTNWVFVDAQTGRPRSVPPAIQGMFTIIADEPPLE